jgi:hypothetical protein
VYTQTFGVHDTYSSIRPSVVGTVALKWLGEGKSFTKIFPETKETLRGMYCFSKCPRLKSSFVNMTTEMKVHVVALQVCFKVFFQVIMLYIMFSSMFTRDRRYVYSSVQIYLKY